MPKIITAILFLTLLVGYYLIYHADLDCDTAWFWYFLIDDLKAFWVALAFSFAAWKTTNFRYAFMCLGICTFDVVTQALDSNKKGDWGQLVTNILIALALAYIIRRGWDKFRLWYKTRHEKNNP